VAQDRLVNDHSQYSAAPLVQRFCHKLYNIELFQNSSSNILHITIPLVVSFLHSSVNPFSINKYIKLNYLHGAPPWVVELERGPTF